MLQTGWGYFRVFINFSTSGHFPWHKLSKALLFGPKINIIQWWGFYYLVTTFKKYGYMYVDFLLFVGCYETEEFQKYDRISVRG